MITLTSSTQSPEEMAAALAARGQVVVPDEPEPKPASAEPARNDQTKPPEQSAPGGETHKASDGETAPVPEAGKDQTQDPQKRPGEKPAESAVETKSEEPKPSPGKFKADKQKLRDQISRLSDDLDLERGSKAKIRAELDEARTRLAVLEKPAAAEAKKDDGPVKPKRPVRAEFFAAEDPDAAYEAAMDQYDDNVSAFHAAVTEKTVNDKLAARAEDDRKAEAEAAGKQAYAEFEKRRDQDRKSIEDYDDVFAELGEHPIDFPKDGVMELAVMEAEHPGILIHYFGKDALDNEGKEFHRISRLSPVRQVAELTRLEARLVKEHEERAKQEKPAGATVVVPEKPSEEVPAKPQLKARPDEPIEPVSGRTRGATPSLAQATSPKDYIRLRNTGVNR